LFSRCWALGWPISRIVLIEDKQAAVPKTPGLKPTQSKLAFSGLKATAPSDEEVTD
jgi:hypothetical protein